MRTYAFLILAFLLPGCSKKADTTEEEEAEASTEETDATDETDDSDVPEPAADVAAVYTAISTQIASMNVTGATSLRLAGTTFTANT